MTATSGRTCLVTGGASGLGVAIAEKLALAEGYRVIIACRDLDRGKAAADKLNSRCTFAHAPSDANSDADTARRQRKPGITSAVKLDLADFQTVRNCAAEVVEILRKEKDAADSTRYPGLQLLVCNAAVVQPQYSETKDGIEETLAVNHYGHFLLVHLLRPALEASTVGARVVYVSSSLHRRVTAETVRRNVRRPSLISYPEDMSRFRGFPDQYALSKRFNALVAHYLASRVLPPALTAASVSPGFIPTTSLGRNFNPLVRLAMKYAVPLLLYRKVKNTEQGAEAVLRVALAQRDDGFVNGGYQEDGKWMEDWGADPDAEKELWSASCEVVGISEHDVSSCVQYRSKEE